MKILLIILLTTTVASAQMRNFNEFPLKGKIKSYQICKVTGDSLHEKETVIESATNDKNGRLLTMTANYEYGEHKQVQTVINGLTITTYECQCKDITDFVKNFQIHDKAELKNKPSYGTASPPTKRVRIETLDKNGNTVLVGNYSQSGYKTSETRFTYDHAKNILSEEFYNFDDKLSYSEKNKYDSKGHLVKKSTTSIDFPYETEEIYKYDNYRKNLVEYKLYEKGVLKKHHAFRIRDSSNKKTFIRFDSLKMREFPDSEIIYDKNKRAIKKIEFYSDGTVQNTTETTNFSNGYVRSKSFYSKENRLLRTIEFANDRNNNWTVLNLYQLVTSGPKNAQKTEVQITKYKLKIEYYK